MRPKRTRAVFQLKVTLRDIEPPIWRRIQLFEDTKLPQLHRILQLLFNWEDYHLHSFVVGRRVYSVPHEDDAFTERKVIDEKRVPLNRIVDRVGATFEYAYDFGDGWQHEIMLEAILLPDPEAFYPRCIAGARNGPPEDVGGPGGYADYIEALADPAHGEHENLLAWRGPFDPEAFSLDEINASLRKMFSRRTASKRAVASAKVGADLDHLTRFMLAALRGASMPEVPKQRISPGTTLPLEITDRERELILKQSLAPDELTTKLRVVPPHGAPCVVRYTLDDLDDLAGYIAFESNHAKDRKVRKEWQAIYEKIAALLESYTDGDQ
mgnify:CR=1 FL=1